METGEAVAFRSTGQGPGNVPLVHRARAKLQLDQAADDGDNS
jgi:hypothetical protein